MPPTPPFLPAIRSYSAAADDDLVELLVDGMTVRVPPGTTILQVCFLLTFTPVRITAPLFKHSVVLVTESPQLLVGWQQVALPSLCSLHTTKRGPYALDLTVFKKKKRWKGGRRKEEKNWKSRFPFPSHSPPLQSVRSSTSNHLYLCLGLLSRSFFALRHHNIFVLLEKIESSNASAPFYSSASSLARTVHPCTCNFLP